MAEEDDEDDDEDNDKKDKKFYERRNSNIDESEAQVETALINGDVRPGMEARRRTSLIVVVE